MFAYNLYRLGAFLARRLPLPIARRLAAAVGRIICGFQRRNRRYLYWNLDTAFGADLSRPELRKLRLAIFGNFAVFVADFLKFPEITREALAKWLTPESFDRMKRIEAIAARSPVVFFTAHVGNWELGAASVALMGHRLTVLADVHPSPQVTSFFNGRRESKGLSVVPVTAFHKCLRALKSGSMVAIVGDRPVTGQGITSEFFGRPTLVPDGHAVLARRFGAAVLPCFLFMTPGGLYDLVVEDPVVPPVTDDEEADVRECVARCLAVVERAVRAHPDQWYVFRPVWPPGSRTRDRRAARGSRTSGWPEEARNAPEGRA